MRNVFGQVWLVVVAVMVVLGGSGVARAVEFNYLDPGYSQEIFTGPLQPSEGGFAWTPSGALLTRVGSSVVEYNLAQTANLHMGTNAHAVNTVHPVSGLGGTGIGMTNGLDGYIYTNSSSGLQRFNTTTWTAQNLTSTPSQGFGITTLPDGRIAYTDSFYNSSFGSQVWVYNPGTSTNTLIYTAPANVLIDGIVAGPNGDIAMAGQTDQSLRIITNTGTPIATITGLSHFPDGMAFSPTTPGRIYANNNDGSITRYDLGVNYASTPVMTDIALSIPGSTSYGDLAAVGPDCAFYVSEYNQTISGYHGSTLNVATHWDNGVTNAEASYTRISAVIQNPDGSTTPFCDFYTPLEGADMPEPASLAMLGAGALGLVLARRRGQVRA